MGGSIGSVVPAPTSITRPETGRVIGAGVYPPQPPYGDWASNSAKPALSHTGNSAAIVGSARSPRPEQLARFGCATGAQLTDDERILD
jgi:hypothetical protein